MVLLSVIIPVYNTGKFLRHSLASVLKQVDKNVEIICIDDGSIDDSGIICDEFAKKYNCVKVYHQSNGGVSSARNLALSHAVGKYIAWVDSDDYVADDWYQSLKPILKKEVDLIFFEHYRVENGMLHRIRYSTNSMIIDKDKFIYELTMDTKIHNYLCDKVFKRSLFKQILFPMDISFMEDYSILHKVCYKAKTIYCLAKPLYFYVIRYNSISHVINFQDQYQGIKIAKMRYDWLLEQHMKISCFGYLKPCMDFLVLVYKKGKENEWREKCTTCRSEICRHIYSLLLNRDVPLKYKVKFSMVYLNILKFTYRMWLKVRGGGTFDCINYWGHSSWGDSYSERVLLC